MHFPPEPGLGAEAWGIFNLKYPQFQFCLLHRNLGALRVRFARQGSRFLSHCTWNLIYIDFFRPIPRNRGNYQKYHAFIWRFQRPIPRFRGDRGKSRWKVPAIAVPTEEVINLTNTMTKKITQATTRRPNRDPEIYEKLASDELGVFALSLLFRYLVWLICFQLHSISNEISCKPWNRPPTPRDYLHTYHVTWGVVALSCVTWLL